VHPSLGKTGCPDEKDAIVQEFVREMLDFYHCTGKACTAAGFPVLSLKKAQNKCTFASFLGTAVLL